MTKGASEMPEEYDLHLEHERAAEAPRASRDAVLRRLDASLPGFATIAPLDVAASLETARSGVPSPADRSIAGGIGAPASALSVLVGRPLLLAGLLALGGLGGAAIHAALAAPRVVYVDRIVSTPSPPTSSHDPSRDVAPPVSVATTPVVVAPSKSGGRPSPQLDRESTLSIERGLLDRARGAVMRGETEEAERALREHQARFAHGELREEREALFIKVLARSGRIDEARARAESFRHDFPRSLLSMGIEAELR